MNDITLRPLLAEDSEVLFHWRNDPVVIQNSRVAIKAEWSDHERWFAKRLTNPEGETYRVATKDGAKVGLVWTTTNEHGRELHYRVAPEWRSRGIGTEMVKTFVEDLDLWPFTCPIIKGNVPSEKIARSLCLLPAEEAPVAENDPRILVNWR